MQNQHADEHRRAGHQAAVEREPVVHRVERGEDVGSQDVRGLPADEDRRRADALQMSRAFRLSVSVSDERTYRHDGGRGGRRTTISEDEEHGAEDGDGLVRREEAGEDADGAADAGHGGDERDGDVPAEQAVEQPAGLEDVDHAAHGGGVGVQRGRHAEVLLAVHRERHVEDVDQPARRELADQRDYLHGSRAKRIPSRS